jgi:hypothetical protein
MHLDIDLWTALVNQFKWNMLAFIYFKLKVILITLTADKSPKNIKTKTEKEQSHELPGTTQRKGWSWSSDLDEARDVSKQVRSINCVHQPTIQFWQLIDILNVLTHKLLIKLLTIVITSCQKCTKPRLHMEICVINK